MNRKEILELKKRFTKTQCTFTKVCGCYVTSDKSIAVEFRQGFLNLPEEEFHKYLDISKKVLSGGVGNNLLQLEFPLDENYQSEKQGFLMQLKRSALKDDQLLRDFYNSIIDSLDYGGNYLIVLFHDIYDVMTKTSDNLKLDESEEMYEYILCAICPVERSDAALGYFEDEQKIKARIRDWIVELPMLGFVFPGFTDRSSDVNITMYYTKNTKEPHEEFMEEVLGCKSKRTATLQKDTFQSIIKSTVNMDDGESDQVFRDVQDNLSAMIEEYNEIYEDSDAEPITLSMDKVRDLLADSGVPSGTAAKIEATYKQVFGDEPPLAETLMDKKIVKANAQKKKEEQLTKQVATLETQLNEIKVNTSSDTAVNELDAPQSETRNETSNVDVVLHVKPAKLSSIKTDIIDGQRCIIVPIHDDELATVNGMDDLI